MSASGHSLLVNMHDVVMPYFSAKGDGHCHIHLQDHRMTMTTPYLYSVGYIYPHWYPNLITMFNASLAIHPSIPP